MGPVPKNKDVKSLSPGPGYYENKTIIGKDGPS